MASASPARRTAAYAAEALPERQPAVAILLPTTIGGLAAVAATIIVTMLLAVGPGVFEALTGRQLLGDGESFLNARAAARAAIDLRQPTAIARWLGTLLLLTAAIVAAVIGLIRRHRRDGRHGSARAWGGLAMVMAAAACAAEVPLGGLVGGLFADVTGIAIGPAGIGWWFTLAAAVGGGISLWTVLSLADRLGTSIWLALAGVAWLTAAGHACLGRGDAAPVWTIATWAIGTACIAVAMLTAARGVIREARGEAGRSGARSRPVESRPAAAAATAPASRPDPWGAAEQEGDETEFVDGSEDHASFRHLSKAERKRLKKLARLQRAG